MIKKLIKLANSLDKMNLKIEVDLLDTIIKKASEDQDDQGFELSLEEDNPEQEVELELETINESVASGDWVIRAMTRAQEEYVVKKERFPTLYDTEPAGDGPDGFKIYNVKPDERRAVVVTGNLANKILNAFPDVSPMPNSELHAWLEENASIIPARKQSQVFAKQSDGDTSVKTKVEASEGKEFFSFEAPWGGTMPAKEDDILIIEDDQFYRIARAEFDQTYQSIDGE
jgi:hypothetical protein